MGFTRDGILGTDPAPLAAGDPLDLFGGGDSPGSLGIDPPATPGGGTAPTPLDVAPRIIARVTKDWEPLNPRTTPAIVVQSKTLEGVGRELDRLSEWGEGGGSLRVDTIPVGTSTNLTVNLHANLVYRLPRWTGYDKASEAAQTEWNKMFRKLVAHEDRHVEIAVEEANQLASDLVGHDIDDIGALVTAANRRMSKRQQQLDTDTANGSRTGVPYGDVILDTSVV